ncbi:hypothetical protein ACIQVL_03115 [Streptomyces sp. NPDC090499]|uniref:hypothetical protein n=1 Tax=Streptomyces sp. NPDC090499 TaxID=3365965 RepID=UPI0037FF9D85
MIQQPPDGKIKKALADLSLPVPLTADSLFAVMREHYQTHYGRALDLWRGPSPVPGLHANALWLTRSGAESDVVWLDDALTGDAATHSLSHEFGHQRLRHRPLELPAEPPSAKPKTYEFLSPDFLGGCLFGRARSHDGPQDPEYVRVEDEAERFAFLLRRRAADMARDTRHHDPLVNRLHRSL